MIVADYVTKASMIAGVTPLSGIAQDLNLTSMCYNIFQMTLNDVNSDTAISLIQDVYDYQRDAIAGGNIVAPESAYSYRTNDHWFDFIIDPSAQTVASAVPMFGPFTIADKYPLPPDCRRIMIALTENRQEVLKTTFPEVQKGKTSVGWVGDMFAVNNGFIWLTRPMQLKIVYVKEFNFINDLEIEIDIPKEMESYFIYVLAKNLALGLGQTEAAARCEVLATQAYAQLLKNTTNNQGRIYINPLASDARFDADFNWGW